MPKSATLSRAVETATKCLVTASVRASWVSVSAPAAASFSQSHSRARRALVSVSRVPKVLEATMKRVVSGSRSLVVSATRSEERRVGKEWRAGGAAETGRERGERAATDSGVQRDG